MEDALGKTFDLTAMVTFLFVALRIDWSVKLLSYGKKSVSDFGHTELLVTRLLSAFCALGLFIYLIDLFFR
jgi:hypothetical protein